MAGMYQQPAPSPVVHYAEDYQEDNNISSYPEPPMAYQTARYGPAPTPGLPQKRQSVQDQCPQCGNFEAKWNHSIKPYAANGKRNGCFNKFFYRCETCGLNGVNPNPTPGCASVMMGQGTMKGVTGQQQPQQQQPPVYQQQRAIQQQPPPPPPPQPQQPQPPPPQPSSITTLDGLHFRLQDLGSDVTFIRDSLLTLEKKVMQKLHSLSSSNPTASSTSSTTKVFSPTTRKITTATVSPPSPVFQSDEEEEEKGKEPAA